MAVMPQQEGWAEKERALFDAQVRKGDPWVEPEPFAVDTRANAYAPLDGKEDEASLDDAHELHVSMEATPGGFDLLRWGNIGENGDVAFFHSRHEECGEARLQLVTRCAEALRLVSEVFEFNPYFVALFYQKNTLSRFLTRDGSIGQGQGMLLNMWPVEVRCLEKGIADPRSDPFVYCYLYGLFVHKLAHFHYINHGTQVWSGPLRSPGRLVRRLVFSFLVLCTRCFASSACRPRCLFLMFLCLHSPPYVYVHARTMLYLFIYSPSCVYVHARTMLYPFSTQHFFYMNEIQFEFMDRWIDLLLNLGFDPAAIQMDPELAKMLSCPLADNRKIVN